jgi:hypothetical protein
MRLALAALALTACVPTHSEPAFYVPHEIGWQDGETAYAIGPFDSRMEMRRALGECCHRYEGYELLDVEDSETAETRGSAARIGYGAFARSRSKTLHEIRAIFRCK